MMGCFDTIMVFMRCPYCRKYEHFDAQTKDMNSSMFTFHALPEDWFSKNKIGDRDFRLVFPVFKQFPNDKEANVWKNQAEFAEARATLAKEFGSKLKYVNVNADCHSTKCDTWARKRDMIEYGYKSGFGRMFEGKIKIEKGMFIGEIYDIVLLDKRINYKRKKAKKK